MSAIAGAFARNGGALPLRALGQISDALGSVAPGMARSIVRHPVAMVYRALRTGTVAECHDQPVATETGCIAALEGRVDNLPELRRHLGSRGGRALSVPEILAALYQRERNGGVRRVIGDFAFALWDARRNCLLLGCDALGRKPLYYSVDRDRVMWSTRCVPLVDAVDPERALDREFVADYLANQASQASPFAKVAVVAAGSIVEVTERAVRTSQHWTPAADGVITYATDGEYQEAFRSIFREAVRCRLPTDTVFAELSGGLDSSAIACTTASIRASEGGLPDSLKTVSHVYERAATSDERPFIRIVEEHLNQRGEWVCEADAPLLQPLPKGLDADLPTNGLFYLRQTEIVGNHMKRANSRVLLSGIGGDQLFWSEPPHGLELADDLIKRDFRALHEHCLRAAHESKRSYVQTAWEGGVFPLLPRGLRAAMLPKSDVGSWYGAEFLRETHFAERTMPLPSDIGFALPSTAMQHGIIKSAMRHFALEQCQVGDAIDIRYPFLDRRLVEFALALPLSQMVRPGESRAILRRALRPDVPDEILQRRTKAGPGEAFVRSIAREWSWIARILAKPRLAGLSVVDDLRFARAMQLARYGYVANEGQLAKTLSLELWLRYLEEERPRFGETAPPDLRQEQCISGGRYVEQDEGEQSEAVRHAGRL